MTAVTPESVAEHRAEPRPSALARRLAALLVQIRSAAGEGLEATIARAVDEAFAGIAREFRR
ncbi:MAG TPA: hypothetical protein VLT82_12605 [Myxococcaceae bacterium]|nr:hypothetical protein [Myxococcaceae bacterium]